VNWITREKVKADRVTCPAALKKFVDKDAEFVFAPANKVWRKAANRRHAVRSSGVKLGHNSKECSFRAIAKKYDLSDNLAVGSLGKIVYGKDTTTPSGINRKVVTLKPSLKAFAILGASRMTTRSTLPNGLSMMRSMSIARKWCAPAKPKRMLK
jgi:hypothetical protein